MFLIEARVSSRPAILVTMVSGIINLLSLNNSIWIMIFFFFNRKLNNLVCSFVFSGIIFDNIILYLFMYEQVFGLHCFIGVSLQQ